VKVELFYFEGCPSYQRLLPRLARLLEDAGVDAELEVRCVQSAEAARRVRFLGSPTVRVDGRDVEPGAEQRHDFGLKCRLYHSPAGISGELPDEWILAALSEA
jgi:hypothetical protein